MIASDYLILQVPKRIQALRRVCAVKQDVEGIRPLQRRGGA
jgi:hypothetical protein